MFVETLFFCYVCLLRSQLSCVRAGETGFIHYRGRVVVVLTLSKNVLLYTLKVHMGMGLHLNKSLLRWEGFLRSKIIVKLKSRSGEGQVKVR